MSDPTLAGDADELTQALNGLATSIDAERTRNDRLRQVVKGVIVALVVALAAAAIGIVAAVQARHAVDCTTATANRRTYDNVTYLAAEYQKVHNQGAGFTRLRDDLLAKNGPGAFVALDTVVNATEGYANSTVILGKLRTYGVQIHTDSRGLVTVTVPAHLKSDVVC